MKRLLRAAFSAASMLTTVPALAQTAAVPANPPPALAEPSPEQMTLARALLAKMGNNPDATIQGMRGPMIGLMRQMGITQQDRAQALVNEAVLPLMQEHIGAYLDQRARDYAQALTADDLKEAIAFYDTPAGQDLIRAEPVLARSRLTGLTQWIGELRPEMQTRIAGVMQAHGWTAAPPAQPR